MSTTTSTEPRSSCSRCPTDPNGNGDSDSEGKSGPAEVEDSSSSDEYESDDGEDVALQMLNNIDRLLKKRKLQDEFLNGKGSQEGRQGSQEKVPAHRKILEPIKNHLFSVKSSPAWIPPTPILPMPPVPPMVMDASAEMPLVSFSNANGVQT